MCVWIVIGCVLLYGVVVVCVVFFLCVCLCVCFFICVRFVCDVLRLRVIVEWCVLREVYCVMLYGLFVCCCLSRPYHVKCVLGGFIA